MPDTQRLIDYSYEYSDVFITRHLSYCFECGSENVHHMGGTMNNAFSMENVNCFDCGNSWAVKRRLEMYPRVRA